MWKYQQGTPCPAPATLASQYADLFSPPAAVAFVDQDKQKPLHAPKRQPTTETARAANGPTATVMDDVFNDYNDNTTRNISKLMRDEFKNARPGSGLLKKPKRAAAGASAHVGVFDDGEGKVEKDGPGSMGAGAIKARRPQKIKLDTVKEDHPSISDQLDISAMEDPDETLAKNPVSMSGVEAQKGTRRRTIWVPSDDTTVMSIHPGAYDQTLRDDTLYPPPRRPSKRGSIQSTPKPEPLQHVNQPRQSMSVAPKRAPLKALAPVQPNVMLHDRVKRLVNGKENIAPGAGVAKNGSKTALDTDQKPLKRTTTQPAMKAAPLARVSLLSQATAASQAKSAPLKKRSVPEPKEEYGRVKVPLTKDPRSRLSTESKASLIVRKPGTTPRTSLERHIEKRVPGKMSISDVKPRISGNLSRYPVLPDDLLQPELYEDNWLSHQEIALTQLVNGVFQQANSKPLLPRNDVASLRKELLKSYQSSTVVTLHKRLKASLLYGALSMPRDSKDLPHLREDVGLRRQFLDLWIQSYTIDALQAAAEVVFGRVMTMKPRDAASVAQSLGSDSGSGSPRERELRRFMLTFLIHHEDAIAAPQPVTDDKAPKHGSPEWFWQRTVLQSLMLIHVLDQAKLTGVISGCLFQKSSIRKSSVSVLHAFSRMLLPWIGDATRPLGHLNYIVPHTQHPLQEYDYRIENLAVDLRNGVLLTRFVELLLYPPSSLRAEPDQTITLALPDGETLTSILSPGQEETWALSQHLKFPSIGRAQKLHNVQIALSALQGVNRGLAAAAIEAIKPEDIVDGHREKTLSLLWSLVSKWGLGLLVDWDELRRETQRFAKDESAFDARRYLDEDDEDAAAAAQLPSQPDDHEQANLLKAWAAAICARRGIEIKNLTTSFSSGEALACIVDAYAEYLPPSSTTMTSKSAKASHASSTTRTTTQSALGALGCSSAFISLFSSSSSSSSAATAGLFIPSRTTTTALLAFLTSRLLPLARAHTAARRLQRAWRAVLARRDVSKRIAALRVAHACRDIVALRDRFEGAALALQRAWRHRCRRVRDRRDAEATSVQMLVRGWLVRRALGLGSSSSMGHVGRSGGRVMGGW